MKFIQGNNRTQINLFPVSLDQSIDKTLGKAFAKIFGLRHKGDYGDFFDLDKEQTMTFFKPVESLLQEIESL
jgi:uncharacterized protein (UPF0332 family)